MAERGFDRETLLDLTVNVIPLAIILFFTVLFSVFNPFGWTLFDSTFQYALLVIPFVGLALLTYVSARAISADEKRMAADTDAVDDTGATDDTDATETADSTETIDNAGETEGTGTGETTERSTGKTDTDDRDGNAGSDGDTKEDTGETDSEGTASTE